MSEQKINYEYIIRGDQPPIEDERKQSIGNEEQYGDKKDIQELEWTEQERQTIGMVCQAATKFLKDIGIEIDLEIDRVHLVNSKEYRDMRGSTSESESVAYFSDGHIYLQRTNSRADLIVDFSHEIAHAMSFLKKRINILENTKDEITYETEILRHGYAAKSGNMEKMVVGRGFDEAMTEIIGWNIRNRVVEKQTFLSEKEELWVSDASYFNNNYQPQIILLQEIFKRLEPEKPEVGAANMMHDYITGNPQTYKDIQNMFREQGIKDGLKILMAMDTSIESAKETAKKLHLTTALEGIHQWQDERKK
jgi:hypothetical protein